MAIECAEGKSGDHSLKPVTLGQVNGFEVLIKYFLDQASVFFYVPDNDKGDIWTEGSPAREVALLAFPGEATEATGVADVVQHLIEQGV